MDVFIKIGEFLGKTVAGLALVICVCISIFIIGYASHGAWFIFMQGWRTFVR